MTQQPSFRRAEAWSAKARDYEDMFVPLSAAAARLAVEEIELKASEDFLDIAAGTGAVTLEAARAGASVVAIDYAPGMLEALCGKLAREGVAGVKTALMDGQELTFENASFDAAGSNFGLVFFRDAFRGIAEMRRVLRPRGRAFVTSMARPGTSQLMQLIAEALRCVGADAGRQPAPAVELADHSSLAAALERGGFNDVRVATATVPWKLKVPLEFWERWALSAPPIVDMMRTVSDATKSAAGQEFQRLVEQEFEDRPVEFPTEILLGIGRR